jgi:hypothetical protein
VGSENPHDAPYLTIAKLSEAGAERAPAEFVAVIDSV